MRNYPIKVVLFISGLLVFLVFSCQRSVLPVPSNPGDSTKTSHPDSTMSSSDTTVNLRLGLLLWLPFDGNMADSSGNGNQTTPLNGASLTYDEHGYANNAFGANGTNQVILVTNNGSIKLDTAYTISFNFMTLDLTTRHAYLSMVDFSNGFAPTFEIANSVPAFPSDFFVGVNDSTAGCDNYGTNNINMVADTTTFVPQPESWYNAIIIYHKGSVKAYINGRLISSKNGTGTSALNCPASNIVVGGWWTGDPENLDGKIDDIRLYNRGLNAKEIAKLARRFQETP